MRQLKKSVLSLHVKSPAAVGSDVENNFLVGIQSKIGGSGTESHSVDDFDFLAGRVSEAQNEKALAFTAVDELIGPCFEKHRIGHGRSQPPVLLAAHGFGHKGK